MAANDKLTTDQAGAAVRKMGTRGPQTAAGLTPASMPQRPRRAAARAFDQTVTADDTRTAVRPAASAATGSPALDYIAAALRPLAVAVAELANARGNARQHSDRDIAALTESLRRFGQRKAIVAMREYRGVRH